MKKREIPHIFYLYLHSKIFEKQHGNDIPLRELSHYLFQWKIPQKLRPLIIKELEILELLKRQRYKFKIERPKLYEENINKFYEQLGLFEKEKKEKE